MGCGVVDEALPYVVVVVHEELLNMLESFVLFIYVKVVYY